MFEFFYIFQEFHTRRIFILSNPIRLTIDSSARFELYLVPTVGVKLFPTKGNFLLQSFAENGQVLFTSNMGTANPADF
jgi:hypothetical protein